MRSAHRQLSIDQQLLHSRARRELRSREAAEGADPSDGSNAQAKGLASACIASVLAGERPAASGPTEGASGAVSGAANLSGKADSRGHPAARACVGDRTCPGDCRCPTDPTLAARRRCTRCTSSSAPRWSPFAGYDMPVSYPAGILAEHRHCREAAALFDVSHMGQLRLVGADAAARARDAGAGRRRRPGAGQAALRALHQRRRRHPRRPDGHAARRPSVPGRQRRLQGGRHRATCARRSAHRCAHRSRCPSTRCSRCRARRPRRRSRGSRRPSRS